MASSTSSWSPDLIAYAIRDWLFEYHRLPVDRDWRQDRKHTQDEMQRWLQTKPDGRPRWPSSSTVRSHLLSMERACYFALVGTHFNEPDDFPTGKGERDRFIRAAYEDALAHTLGSYRTARGRADLSRPVAPPAEPVPTPGRTIAAGNFTLLDPAKPSESLTREEHLSEKYSASEPDDL